MANLDLTKYGITGTTEIIHNPSYESLFEDEMAPGLTGSDVGVLTELDAVNVMTGIYTGRSPKDKYIVMDETSKDTVWWTTEGYPNDNHPMTPEVWTEIKKLAKDQFNLWDFYEQIQQVKKMGNIKDLASMIPGVGKAIKDVDIPDDAFKSTEAIILSMTPYEREHPEQINGSRRKRIAAGSGTTLPDVNRLLKQFEGTRKVMKGAMTGNLAQRMKGFRR